MKSPLPGMDPYLEQHWGDVRQAFVTYIRDLLQPRLPEPLRARMQERVYLMLPVGMRPDSFSIREPRTENYVQVIDVRSGHRVVTAIEVVSPTNKRAGEGKRLSLQKRQDMIDQPRPPERPRAVLSQRRL